MQEINDLMQIQNKQTPTYIHRSQLHIDRSKKPLPQVDKALHILEKNLEFIFNRLVNKWQVFLIKFHGMDDLLVHQMDVNGEPTMALVRQLQANLNKNTRHNTLDAVETSKEWVRNAKEIMYWQKWMKAKNISQVAKDMTSYFMNVCKTHKKGITIPRGYDGFILNKTA